MRQPAETNDPFRRFKRRWWLVGILAPLLAFGVMVTFELATHVPNIAITVACGIIVWVAVIQFMWRFDCPNCGRRVGGRVNLVSRHCPFCKTKLL